MTTVFRVTPVIILFAFFLSVGQVMSQIQTEYIERTGDLNFDRIREYVDQQLEGDTSKYARKSRKFFNRWAHQYRGRLNADGEIINFPEHNYREMQRFLRGNPNTGADQRSLHGSWENVTPLDFSPDEPANGRVNCIAVDPNNSNIIYVGTPVGGLWKSFNGGSSWTDMTPGLDNLGVTSINIDYNNPNVVYILTGGGDGRDCPSMGVFKSVNGGYDWVRTDLSYEDPDYTLAYKMVMHPEDPQKMWALYNHGASLTSNGWTTRTWIDSLADHPMRDIEFVPGQPDTMYASSTKRIFRSTDGGQEWTVLSEEAIGLPDTSENWSRVALAVSQEFPGIVYALFARDTPDDEDSWGYHELYFSNNYGNNWQLRSSGVDMVSDQSWYNLEITLQPGSPHIVYVGAVNFWKSTDWGQSFTRISVGEGLPSIHADVHDLTWDGNTLYTGTDGGISKTTDGGVTYTNLTAGLNILQVYDIDVEGSWIICGTQDNGTNEWILGDPVADRIFGGDGLECIYDPSDNGKFVSTQGSRHRCIPFNCWGHITPPGHSDIWQSAWEMHPLNYDTLYACEHSIARSFNRGSNWVDLAPPFTEDTRRIEAIAIGVDQPNRMYATNTVQLLRSDNINNTVWSSVTWTDVTGTLSANPELKRFGEITLDPADADRVWITMFGYDAGEKVFQSEDGGTTWTNITYNLPNVPVYTIEFVPGSNDALYVGTDFGVFFKDASMQEWMWFSNGLPKTRVDDMKLTEDFIYVGTYGRGVWRSPYVTSCEEIIVVDDTVDPSPPNSTGTQVYSANSIISSSQTISGGFGTNVKYSAGLFITLTPGFHVKQLSNFHAVMDGCPD